MVKNTKISAKKPKQVATASKAITKDAKKLKAAAKNVEQKAPKVKKIEESAEALARRQAKKIALKLKKKQKKQQAKAKAVEQLPENQEQKSTNVGKNKKAAAGKAASAMPTPKQKPTKTPAKKAQKKAERVIIDMQDPAILAATVFVGNLPINTKNVQIQRLFADYAPVHSVRLRTANGKKLFKHKMRKETNALIAYVVLKDAAAAESALSLNGTEFKGNHLRVTRATDKAPADVKRTIFVGNLKYTANEEKLREIFSSCGEIEYIRCLQATPKEIASSTKKDIKSGCKGVAYVCFKTAEAVGLALELKDTMLDERPINVERYSTKKQGAMEARKEAEKLQKTAKKSKDSKKQTDKPKTVSTDDAAKKKTAYQGVKIDKIKKKKNKADKQLKAVAKKIAPKTLLKS